MQKYLNNVQDQFGNALGSVTVTVNILPGGGPATIFSDNGVTPKANPFTNDSDGEFNFYAANGRYDIELTGPLTESITDIRLLDIASGISSLAIFTDIVTATPPTTEAVTGNYEIYDLDGDDLLTQLGYNGSNTLRLTNLMHGASVGLFGEDAAGVARTILIGDPDNQLTLYNAGTARMDMHSTGRVRVFSDTSTDAEQRSINFAHADTTVRAQVGHIGDDNLDLKNLIHGGDVYISGEDAGGGARRFLTADPDSITTLRGDTGVNLRVAMTGETASEIAVECIGNAGVNLYFNALKTFGLEAAGEAVIFGDLNTTIDFRVLYGAHADGTHRWALGQENGSDFAMRNEIHGGIVHLSAEDSGGIARFFIQGDPDGITDLRGDTDVQILVNVGSELAVNCVANGKVGLYFNQIEKFRTQDNTIADAVSGAEVLDGNNVWQEVGFNVLGQVLTDANYTIHRSECGYDIYKQASGAVTYTIPAAAAAGQTDIPFGAVYEITNEDTEDLTIDGTEAGITLRWCPTGGTGDRTLAQWGIARLKKRSDSLWFITGIGIT